MAPSRRRDGWAEDCDWLASFGVAPSEWPGRLGTTVAGLAKALYRAGRPDLARPLSAAYHRELARRPSGGHCVVCGLPLTVGQRLACSRRHAARWREEQRRGIP